MKHPDKWRETADIHALPFRRISVLEILGYPHAGNDVFHVRALYRQAEITAYVKVERQQGADVANEAHILSQIPFSFLPEVIEYSLDEPRYIVTKEVCGERLSFIAANDPAADINEYLHKQAHALFLHHALQIDCTPVKDRRFFHIPADEFFEKHELESVHAFLTSNGPRGHNKCFVHGDFHYANILWEGGEISCVLDYELSGLGIREFDMAWSIFLRPGQVFAQGWDSVEAFLYGYKGDYSPAAFYYYYVQIGARFYPLGDESYADNVTLLLARAIEAYNAL